MSSGTWAALLSLVISTAVRAEAGPAAVLTSLVTAELDTRPGLSVLSSADVQQALALEAQKQALGCDSDSCLAEIAGALGVDYVVHGQLGRLERSQVLTLTLFDARTASSAGRTVLQGDSVDALAAQLPQGIDALLARVPTPMPPTATAPTAHKLLVMDLREAGVSQPAPSTRASTDGAFPLLPVLGGGTLALGALAAIGGGVFGALAADAHSQAEATQTFQADAAELYAARDTQALVANVLFGTSGALMLAGAGVLALGLLGGE